MARVIAQAGNQTIGIKVNRPSWADMYRNYPNESITSKQFYLNRPGIVGDLKL